jgi:hypothetical protein
VGEGHNYLVLRARPTPSAKLNAAQKKVRETAGHEDRGSKMDDRR